MITAATWPVVAVPPMSQGRETWDGLLADLFEYQAIPQGG